MKTHCETLIVGAGMSGLLAARELISAGQDVIVIDKAHGVGGRMATRRIDGARFDHGAQFISVRADEFRAHVDIWLEHGAAELWSYGFADGRTGDGSLPTSSDDDTDGVHMPARDGHPRYRGRDGMTSIAKFLAQGADVRLGVQARLVRALHDDGWEVEADAGGTYRATSVILTPPVPQTLDLIAGGSIELDPDVRTRLETIQYAPCVAYLAITSNTVPLPRPGVLRAPSPAIEWIADNHAKGISTEGPAITVHCAEDFSARHYDEPDDELIARVENELASIVDLE
ncbi:MAG: NAD(P)/FAD-dependent oxidoreductase, partial [Spirochaetota bacterium]